MRHEEFITDFPDGKISASIWQGISKEQVDLVKDKMSFSGWGGK